MSNKLKNVSVALVLVLYIRVSTQRQVEKGDSVELQQKTAHKWAKFNGYLISKVYIEGGSSAYKDKRPVFPRMINDILSGRVNCNGILVYSYSRFSRKNRI